MKINQDINHKELIVSNFHSSSIAVERTIDMEKIGVDVEKLPNSFQKLLKLDILPRDFLKPYKNFVSQAETYYAKYGAKTELGFVIENSRAYDLIAKMNEIKSDWEKQVKDDSYAFESMAEDQLTSIEKDPDLIDFPHKTELMEALRAKQPTWEDVAPKLSFDFTINTVGSTNRYNESDAALYRAMEDSVIAIKKGAFGSLIQELCATARRSLKRGLDNDRIHSRTTEAVWVVIEKLNELAFLDKRVRIVHDQLKGAMSKLTRGKALYEHEYDNFISIMMMLANQHLVVSKLDSGEPLIELEEDDLFDEIEEETVEERSEDEATPIAESEEEVLYGCEDDARDYAEGVDLMEEELSLSDLSVDDSCLTVVSDDSHSLENFSF